MYKNYFRLDRLPFLNTADPGFFFNSGTHREALAVMAYGIRAGKGFVVVTGGVGTGKTMLAQALRKEIGEQQHIFIDITSPWVSSDEVFAAIWRGIGLPANKPNETITASSLVSLKDLKERLLTLDNEGRRAVLIVDEANHLPETTLEGMRLFADLESYDRKLLQIVLLGQEELRSALKNHSLRALRDRIALSYHLDALSASDTEAYIRHRILAAGGMTAVFDPNCFALIHEVTGGCPRAINSLCDQSMLFAYGKSLSIVDVALLRDVIARSTLQSGVAELERPRLAPEITSNQASQIPKKARIPNESAAENDQPFALPFQIPTALQNEAPSHNQTRLDSLGQVQHLNVGSRFGSTVTSLAIGLLVGAVVVWAFLGKSVEFRLPITVDQDKKATDLPRPIINGPGNSGASAALPSAAIKIPPSSQSAFMNELPLPSGNLSTGTPQEVMVSQVASLAMLASQQYGSWNATVRDIVAAANPKLETLENIPDGTRVLLPQLSRDAMVVSQNSTQLYIFYGSFESEELAARDVEALSRLSTPAMVVAGGSAASKIYRLYIGPYSSRNDANTVANSLWFKYLPGIK